MKAIAIKQKKQIADLKQSMENEIKKHNLEKNELVNKITASVEQGKLARVRIKLFKYLIYYGYLVNYNFINKMFLYLQLK